MENDLILQPNSENPSERFKQLTLDIDDLNIIIDHYETRANNGLLDEQEAKDLDIKLLLRETKEAELKQVNIDLENLSRALDEMSESVRTAKQKTDMFDRGKRSFHSIDSEEGQAQLESAITSQRKIRIRRNKLEIYEFYKRRIDLVRPDFKTIYGIAGLMRVLGITKKVREINETERAILNTFLADKK